MYPHLRKAQCCAAAWHDGHLEQRLRVLQEPAHHRMACLVVGHGAALLRADDLWQQNAAKQRIRSVAILGPQWHGLPLDKQLCAAPQG